MGFTEAQLGLLLAVLFLFLFVRERKHAVAATEVRDTLLAVAVLDSIHHALDSVTAELVVRTTTSDSLRRVLKSTITPSCIEKRLIGGPLLTVTVIAEDRFRTGGRVVAAEELSRQLAPQLAEARVAECVHQVVVDFVRGLSAIQIRGAEARLRSLRLRVVPGQVRS